MGGQQEWLPLASHLPMWPPLFFIPTILCDFHRSFEFYQIPKFSIRSIENLSQRLAECCFALLLGLCRRWCCNHLFPKCALQNAGCSLQVGRGGGGKKKFSHASRNYPWWRACLVQVENCYNKETYLSLLKSSNFLQIFEDEYIVPINICGTCFGEILLSNQ